jgi:hypothetical protein
MEIVLQSVTSNLTESAIDVPPILLSLHGCMLEDHDPDDGIVQRYFESDAKVRMWANNVAHNACRSTGSIKSPIPCAAVAMRLCTFEQLRIGSKSVGCAVDSAGQCDLSLLTGTVH